MKNPEQRLYEDTLRIVEALVAKDPEPDSPEGVLLTDLATSLEEYEKVKFPL